MSGPILVAGEALYDLVADGDGRLAGHPGGGPFNTARTIGRLGQPVAFLGRISTDGLGRALEASLRADGVDVGSLVHTDEPTTLAVAHVEPDGAARYRFYATGTSVAGLSVEAALDALPAAVGMLHVGTLGLMLEPAASAIEAVVEALAGRALIVVDPNCRPGLVEDREAYRARLIRVLGHSDLVKVSVEDLAWLDPGTPPRPAARALLGLGPRTVLLTCGADGAVALGDWGDIPVAAPTVRVVDTIGAGDAFSGGFLAWWSEHGLDGRRLGRADLVESATRFAAAVAAATCARAGATPPTLVAGAARLEASSIGRPPD